MKLSNFDTRSGECLGQLPCSPDNAAFWVTEKAGVASKPKHRITNFLRSSLAAQAGVYKTTTAIPTEPKPRLFVSTLNSAGQLGEVDLLPGLEHAEFAIGSRMFLRRNKSNEVGHPAP